MAYRSKLPKLIEKGVSKVKRKRTKNKGKGGVPEVKTPDKIDKNRKKGYPGNDDGPKKTPKSNIKGSRTEPTLPKGSKPKGEYEPEIGSRLKKEDIKRQNQAADKMADAGYDLEMLPDSGSAGNGYGVKKGSNPDFKIGDNAFDCYSPRTANASKIRNKISDKVKNQADRIVLNMEGTDLSLKDISNIIKRKPVSNLKELIVIDKKSNIFHLFP
jgi:hypothetical protein